MERNYEEDVGRWIIILDGNGVDDYAGSWYSEGMDRLIGNVYEICALSKTYHTTPDYRIRDEYDNVWTIDSRYCEFVDEEYEFNPKVDDKVSTLF